MSLNNFTYSICWSDFNSQSSRPYGEDEDAFTKARYYRTYNYERNGNVVTISDATVDITMVTLQSWVVKGKTTNDLLQHEQGYYDIPALVAREFYNALLQITARSPRELETKISKAHANYRRKIDSANTRYDDQTNHSQDTAQQNIWNKGIAA